MKVIYELGKLGYVETIRGRNGGIRLGKAPELINIGEVIRHTEDDFNLVECFNGEKPLYTFSDLRIKACFKQSPFRLFGRIGPIHSARYYHESGPYT